MKIGMVLIILVLANPSSIGLAQEYKTLDNEYFSVEYPKDWKVSEYKGDTISYKFGMPLGNDTYVYTTIFIITIDRNGASIDGCGIDQNAKVIFNKDGTFNEKAMHLLESFRPKENIGSFEFQL